MHRRSAPPPVPPAAVPLDRLFDLRYGAVLSPREIEIGRCAVLGVESSEIARQLFISENTVKTHLRHVYRKTSSANRADLLRKLVSRDGGTG